MKNPQVDIIQVMIRDIDSWSSKMNEFLVSNGVQSKDKNLYSLMESVKNLKVRLLNKEYSALLVDENGYIIRAYPMHDFVETSSVPSDITGGYYKYINNKFILDEERQRQMEEV